MQIDVDQLGSVITQALEAFGLGSAKNRYWFLNFCLHTWLHLSIPGEAPANCIFIFSSGQFSKIAWKMPSTRAKWCVWLLLIDLLAVFLFLWRYVLFYKGLCICIIYKVPAIFLGPRETLQGKGESWCTMWTAWLLAYLCPKASSAGRCEVTFDRLSAQR